MRLGALVALLVAGCVSHPPERIERDRILLAAAETCAKELSGSRVMSVNREGIVHIELMDYGDLPRFERCYKEALSKIPELRAFASGELAEQAAATSVAIELRGPAVLVPALVNGVNANLLLDTGSAITIVRPSLAQRAGIHPASEAPRVRVFVMGGGQISVPLVRAQTIRVNEAAVDAIDVGVYEAVPSLPDVDGVLGGNFLNHFKVMIDRQMGRLFLAPLRPRRPF